MFRNWNPFFRIIETKLFPHARTLRTTFRQKLADTFLILSGHDPLDRLFSWSNGALPFFRDGHEPYAGLFDYATLFIPRLLALVSEKLAEAFKSGFIVLKILIAFFTWPIFLLTSCFNMARFLLAVTLTLLVSPLVAVVHGFAQIEGRKLKEEALNLPITSAESQVVFDLSDFPVPKTLKSQLNESSLELEDMNNYALIAEPEWKINKEEQTVTAVLKRPDEVQKNENMPQVFPSPFMNMNISYNEQNFKTPLKAMLTLNIGGITQALEKSENHEGREDLFTCMGAS